MVTGYIVPYMGVGYLSVSMVVHIGVGLLSWALIDKAQVTAVELWHLSVCEGIYGMGPLMDPGCVAQYPIAGRVLFRV